MDKLDERILVLERRRNSLAPTAPEYEACLGAVDAHLLYVGVGKVLCQWAQRRHRSEDPPPEVLRLGAVELALFADHAPHELVDPALVVHAQASAVASRQLGAQLGFDPTSDMRLEIARSNGVHG
jgi:hypothetical protein